MVFIPFTKEERELARTADIAAFLEQRGQVVKRCGSEKLWLHGTERITIRGNVWFNQYEQVGGDAVDFVRCFYGENYPGAVRILLGRDTGTPVAAAKRKERIPFALPPRSADAGRAYAYLRQRGIRADILDAFFSAGMIYQESSVYQNVVFVGFDAQGVPRHANLRGTHRGSTFKGNAGGSDPRFSFHWAGTDGELYLFEAPIDLLSYITLHSDGWRAHSYAASCGVSEHVMWELLALHPQINKVFLCRDSDEKGREANLRTAKALSEKHIGWEILVPEKKDWNEDLMLRQGQNAETDMRSFPGE